MIPADNFKEKCLNFFTGEYSVESFKNQIKGKGYKEVITIFHDFNRKYNEECYSVIVDEVARIRNIPEDYKEHPWSYFLDNDLSDPLEEVENRKYISSLQQIFDEIGDQMIYLDEVKTAEECRRIQAKLENEELNYYVELEDGSSVRAVAWCPVLWEGWECDSRAWVIQKENKHVLLTTDHGEPVEVDVSFLEERIKEYQQVISKTEHLISLLKEQK